MRNKTKCGLRRAHLCILSKNVFESKERKEKARVLERSDFGGRSSYLWCISDQEKRRRLGLQVQRDFKV